METAAINLKAKLSKFNELWTPYIIAQLNEYHIKVVKIQGEFVWHSHPETDEAFFVLSGSMRILLRDGEVALNEGELFIVPRGLEHKPVAPMECAVLLLEPAGTVNTGDSDGGRTKPNDSWI